MHMRPQFAVQGGQCVSGCCVAGARYRPEPFHARSTVVLAANGAVLKF